MARILQNPQVVRLDGEPVITAEPEPQPVQAQLI
jgi:hypothetical protein